MEIKNLTFIIFWFLVNLRRQLLYNHWWQIKESRPDRFWVFIKTPQGRKQTEFYFLLAKICIVFSTLFTYSLVPIFFIVLFFELFLLVQNLLTHSLRYPQMSARGKSLTLTSFVFISMSFIYLLFSPSYLNIILFDIVSYLIPLIGIAWTQIVYQTTLKKEISQARRKINKINPQIIAITGSQGKSSTKHLLCELLNTHYQTQKTPLSHNTPFGITRAINNSLKQKTKFFISEMGAYKKGEINHLCTITPPHIAVITGISPQHLDLFGSFKKLKQAKYELVQNLLSSSPVFINATQNTTQDLIKWSQKNSHPTFTYALNKKADFYSCINQQTNNQTTFTFFTPKTKHVYITNLVINHLVENLTGAMAVAHYLQVPHLKLKKAIKHLPHPDRAVRFIKLSDQISLIDDSYNSTLPGFRSALKELQKHSGQKIIITSGVSELGNQESEAHFQLGKLMRPLNHIFLTTPHLKKPILKGLGTKNISQLHVTTSQNFLRNIIPLIKNVKTIILLEGRLPTKISQSLKTLK